MKYERIEPHIDLNDPEQGFDFASEGDHVRLWFIDWRNRRVVFSFRVVYWFFRRRAGGYCGLPEGQVLEIIDSDVIRSLRDDGTAAAGEELHHFVISTNEEEWCEIVAERMDIEMEV
ncbi:MAG: hypothetical protein A2521_00360 [Deltaproteobacteria bacterium RIFOXYD12_FULL_57_12]|nr:MAG: hypothetical protein A2521_00360 [Deltaproteobacteria bacterium RIFOXYD12_FULL_57_12]